MTDAADALQALQTTARASGFDAMPTLIRVATDLFVGRATPSASEIARFEELVLGLLQVADLPTRVTIARKLAPFEHTPGTVLGRLLTDDMDVAGFVLALSPRVPRDALFGLASDGPDVAACAIARRSDLEPDLVRMLAHHPAPAVAESLAANPRVGLDGEAVAVLVARSASAPTIGARLLARADLDPADLAPLYLQADAAGKRAIRAAIDRPGAATRRAEQTPRLPDSGDTAVFEAVAASGRAGLVAEALASAFGLAVDEAAALVDEPGGEPLVLALHAAGLSRESIGRVLLLTTPAIAISVPRFFELLGLSDEISRNGALRMTAVLSRSRGTEPRHEAYLDAAAGVSRGRPAAAGARASERSAAVSPIQKAG